RDQDGQGCLGAVGLARRIRNDHTIIARIIGRDTRDNVAVGGGAKNGTVVEAPLVIQRRSSDRFNGKGDTIADDDRLTFGLSENRRTLVRTGCDTAHLDTETGGVGASVIQIELERVRSGGKGGAD